MTYEEFANKYCHLCGTQRCHGIYDEVCREGCVHYRREFLKEPEKQINFVTCQNCNGSGVAPNSTAPCKTCCGFGTVIVYEENEHDYESKANC